MPGHYLYFLTPSVQFIDHYCFACEYKNLLNSWSSEVLCRYTCILYNFHIIPTISGFSSNARNRVIQEVVTPRCLATSAPEYPTSWTATHEIILRALTGSRLRLPESSSALDMFLFLQTLLHNSSRSILWPETLRFFFIMSSRSVFIS
jgi:hypothetical protein